MLLQRWARWLVLWDRLLARFWVLLMLSGGLGLRGLGLRLEGTLGLRGTAR